MKKVLIENEDLVVAKSRNGNGVFAKRALKPEEILFEVKGEFVTCNLDEEMDEEERSNTYRFDEEVYISPGKNNITNYINHSCEPNTKIIKKNDRIFVVTINPVSQKEELTFDYSTMLASDDVWEMDCNCGSPICRGKVLQFENIPEDIKSKYISLKIVPDYILEINKKLLD